MKCEHEWIPVYRGRGRICRHCGISKFQANKEAMRIPLYADQRPAEPEEEPVPEEWNDEDVELWGLQ